MEHQIITIGKDLSSAYLGIKEYGPDAVHLLITDQTQDLFPYLTSMLPASIEAFMYRVDPYDGHSVQQVCREIHCRFEGTVRYNLSEGTKIMTHAAFQVAQSLQAPAFYLTQDGRIIDFHTFNASPLTMSMDNAEFIALSGNRYCSYHDIDNLTRDDINASKAIKQFIENFHKEHNQIQHFYSQRCRRRVGALPEFFTLEDKLSVCTSRGTLSIRKGDKPLLQLEAANSCFLYFEGRWWETLVAQQVKIWRDKICVHENGQPLPQTWQSVVFDVSDDPQRSKNEIDILLNDKQKLIIIECKSGQINQDNIYHIDAVRETYGGDISQAILASYYPLDEALLEKCDDLHIHAFAPARYADRIHYLECMPDWLEQVRGIIEI